MQCDWLMWLAICMKLMDAYFFLAVHLKGTVAKIYKIKLRQTECQSESTCTNRTAPYAHSDGHCTNWLYLLLLLLINTKLLKTGVTLRDQHAAAWTGLTFITAVRPFSSHKRWRKKQTHTMTLLCLLQCAFLLHTFSSFPLLALSLAALRLFFPQQSMLSGSEHRHLLHRYAAAVYTADPSLWGHEFQCFYPPPSLANMPAFSIYTSALETCGKLLKRKSIKGYKHAWA